MSGCSARRCMASAPESDHESAGQSDFLLGGPQAESGKRNRRCEFTWTRLLLAVSLATYFGSLAVLLWQIRSPSIKAVIEDPLHRSYCLDHAEDCDKTAPYIFDSVFSLLKQWPNSYAPNGHSLVAGIIPPNTQLFHAQCYSGTPKKPTYFALDP